MSTKTETPNSIPYQPNFRYNIRPLEKRTLPPSLEDDLPFGKVHSDHMLVCDFIAEKGGWQEAEIRPFGPFQLRPDCVTYHYGQQIFEGMKCYRGRDNPDDIFLFRPELNAQRMVTSARRLEMQPVPPELFLQGINQLLAVDSSWVLPFPGSLYVRPTLMAIDEGISYKASSNYRFFVFLCPVKAYYSGKEQGTTVYVEREFVRAVRGGVGEAKCSGNYAPALATMAKASIAGAAQVLWLDAIEHRYVEEVGTSNIMFVYGDKIVTPSLSGSILKGITRKSVLELASHLGLQVEERPISIDEVLQDIENGSLTECFGTGTAVVISPVVALLDGDRKHPVNKGAIGPITTQLRSRLVDIQTGAGADPFAWRQKIPYGEILSQISQ